MPKEHAVNRKELVSERTFILTLDGDVDFQPSSVLLLVDLMAKNRRLGAACGRIHPRGSGPLIWYQKVSDSYFGLNCFSTSILIRRNCFIPAIFSSIFTLFYISIILIVYRVELT